MFAAVQHIDEAILAFIHLRCANDVSDTLSMLFRNPYFWAPVYLFLLVYMYKNFGRKGLWWCGFFLITFLYCDYLSASIIKPLVQRIRPCNNPGLPFSLRDLVVCGSGYSFPSTHATNHFGFAAFLIFTLRQHSRWVMPLSLSWAFSVSLAQLYVGVHYPSDLLGGALLGLLLGGWNAYYFNRRIGLNL